MEELEKGRKKLQGLFEKADRLLESKIKPVEEEGDEVFHLMAKYDSVSKQINALEGDEDGTLGNELKMKLIQKLKATKVSIAEKIVAVGDNNDHMEPE